DAGVVGFSVQGNQGAESALRFVDTRDVLLSATRLLAPAAVFLQVEGPASNGIVVDGGDISKAAKTLAFERKAEAGAVKLRS
ncbi:MAG TPA: glycoside hydrolase, partial [Candidatus Binatia bacterium]|nr:glycoside hydrolase [Candidatus Binatia bacterium]